MKIKIICDQKFIKRIDDYTIKPGDVVEIELLSFKYLDNYCLHKCENCEEEIKIKHKNLLKQLKERGRYICKSCSTISFNKSKKRKGQVWTNSKVDFKNKIFKKWNLKVLGTNHKYRDEVKFVCEFHGECKSNIKNLLRTGCIKCKEDEKRNIEFNSWVLNCNKIHNNYYNYDKVNYINSKEKVIITCPNHGDFEQIPNNHYNGSGCLYCSYKVHIEDFKHRCVKVHNNKYNYNLIEEIKNLDDIVHIVCNKHGIFKQRAVRHLQGSGCPSCNESLGEKQISEFLDKNKIEYIREFKFKNFPNKWCEFDFYLQNYNVCIEYDGEHHFRPIEYFGGEKTFEKTKENDILKNEYCKINNITLLRISYIENISIILIDFFKNNLKMDSIKDTI